MLCQPSSFGWPRRTERCYTLVPSGQDSSGLLGPLEGDVNTSCDCGYVCQRFHALPFPLLGGEKKGDSVTP